MCSVVDTLELLEAASGRLAKEATLNANVDNELLQLVFRAAQDPYVTYGVAKLKLPKPVVTGVSTTERDVMLEQFITFLYDSLSTREVTGNDAKRQLTDLFAKMDSVTQKWCMRILLKNLRCGVQVSTVNKTWPGMIKPFECALCESLKTEPTEGGNFVIVQTINYPVYVEPKLDGLRLITIKAAGIVTMYTRNGTELTTLPTVAEAIRKAPCDNIVFDGEIMGQDWNESASIVMAHKTHKDDASMFYNVFDTMPLDEWKSQKSTKIREKRCFETDNVVKLIASDKVRMVPFIVTNSEKELREYYEICVAKGFEGVVIKDPNAKYIFKRSKSLLKLKPCTTYEGGIVGWYEGRDGTKREGEFGGFDVVLPNGVVTRCGGGFSDVLRSEIMGIGPVLNSKGPKRYIGKVVEMEGQPPLTAEGRVRFPVFCRFRDIEDVDPAVEDALAMYFVNHPEVEK